MKRKIKYNAWVPDLGIMFDDITLYGNGQMGFGEDEFTAALPEGYHIDYDSQCIEKKTTTEDGEEDFESVMVLLTGEDWIWLEEGDFEPIQLTGFTDKNGVEIYEGDILGDWVGTDRGVIQSAKQVYWCENKGAWKLDAGFKQNKTFGDLLGKELRHYAYEVRGNIYQHPELLIPETLNSKLL